MRYMGARLRGLDQGRKQDDALRIDLNKMKQILADIKKRKPKVLAQESGTAKSSIETRIGKKPGPKEAELLTGQKETDVRKSTINLTTAGVNDEITSRNVTSEETGDEDGQSKKKRSNGGLVNETGTGLLESTSPKTKKARK